MRRTRNRYYTIDAENEEEFIKEYENMRKSRLSEKNFELNSKENNQKIEQEDGSSSPKKQKSFLNFGNSDSEDDYLGLGGKPGIDEDEDYLGQMYEDDEILKGDESLIRNQSQNAEEKGIEMLCLYL